MPSSCHTESTQRLVGFAIGTGRYVERGKDYFISLFTFLTVTSFVFTFPRQVHYPQVNSIHSAFFFLQYFSCSVPNASLHSVQETMSGMNELYHCLFALRSSEKGLKNSGLNSYSDPDICHASAVLYQLSYQANLELVVM